LLLHLHGHVSTVGLAGLTTVRISVRYVNAVRILQPIQRLIFQQLLIGGVLSIIRLSRSAAATTTAAVLRVSVCLLDRGHKLSWISAGRIVHFDSSSSTLSRESSVFFRLHG
jgi:hypothetical protein